MQQLETRNSVQDNSRQDIIRLLKKFSRLFKTFWYIFEISRTYAHILCLFYVMFQPHWYNTSNSTNLFFKVHTPTGFGPSVSGGSVCLSVSDPDWSGCEKSRDKILGFWLSWHKFNLRQLKYEVFILYLIFACSVQS